MGDTDVDLLLAKVAATPRRHLPARIGSGTERYEFRAHLGRGAFGDVYEARDRQHGTLVALKRLKGSDPGWLYRFKREYRVVADLSHPNIVRLYELFCEKDQWYLTMELVRGSRFGEHIRRAPEDLRSCFTQLALAIHALHRSGCLHRDIKPSNALVEPTGRVVLLDFGLALERGNRLATAIAGTPPYMAPELGMGNEPTEASDWYAFGVMLFEALAGRIPFDGSESQIFQDKLAGPPSRASLHRSGNDPELEDLALALLSPDSDRRPTGEDVLAALQASTRAREHSGRAAAEIGELPLVGRDRELQQLADALSRSRTGAVLVTVHGEPGMGKSSLVRAFVESRAARGAQLYSGRCRESESVPFKGLDGVVDSMCADLLQMSAAEVAALAPPGAPALVQMFPVLKRVSAFGRGHGDELPVGTPHTARRAAREALRGLLARLAARRPLILFIDDLQWANEDSVGMLLGLLSPPAPPVLFVVAYGRESQGTGGALDRFLMGLVDRFGVERIDMPIEPLDLRGVAQLLSAHPGIAVGTERAMRETAGHPYLLSRLVTAGRWSGGAATDLAGVIGAQLGGLGQEARELLEVVSLSARVLSQRAAFEVVGRSWNTIAIDELRRERLVRCSDPTADGIVEPYHGRVRESVLDTMAPDRRRELHLKIAQYLEMRGRADPEALVHHYRYAGEAALALRWTRIAAEKARDAFAFARAAELFRDAVALAAHDGDRLELLVDLAEAQAQTGHRAAAGHTYVKAAQLAAANGEEEVVAAMRTRAGQHFLLAGHIKKGIGLLADALGAVGVTLPEDTPTSVAATITVGAELATRGLSFSPRTEQEIPAAALRRLDLQLAVGSALAMTDVRAAWVTSQALLEAVEVGEPLRVQRAMAYYAFSNSARAPDHPLIVECIERTRSLAEELDDDCGRAWACLASGMWRSHRAEFPEALYEFREARQRFLADSHQHAREAATAHVASLVLLGNYGIDLPAAERQKARLLEEAVERDDRFVANWARALFGWIDLARGDVDRARENLALARSGWPAANEEFFAAMSMVSEIAIELYDDPATAWETVARLQPTFEALYSSLIPVTRCIFHRLRASSAVAAFVAGRSTRQEAIERIAPSVEIVLDWDYGGPNNRAVESFLLAVEGDRAGYERKVQEAEEGWRRQAQRGPMLAAQLRLHQLRGELDGAVAKIAELRAFGVADPDRYGLLFIGPNTAGVQR